MQSVFILKDLLDECAEVISKFIVQALNATQHCSIQAFHYR